MEENVTRSDVEYIAGEKARQAYYDAINEIDQKLSAIHNELDELADKVRGLAFELERRM